jgi:hypothetical protein
MASLHAHRRMCGLNHASSNSLDDLLRGVTDSDVGDAGSTRWIAFLGRACRGHRQLLSTWGNCGCSGAVLAGGGEGRWGSGGDRPRWFGWLGISTLSQQAAE